MLQTEIQGLKDQVQELHRDLTKHHSLIKTEIMSEILQKSLQMDVQIAAHYSAVEMMRSVFEEVRPARPSTARSLHAVPCHGTLPSSLSPLQVWEETYQRVANEQEIYEGTSDPTPPALSPPCVLQGSSHGHSPPLSPPSPAPRPAAAAAGEQLPDHHHQADRALRPLHRQGEGAAGAQVRGVGGLSGLGGGHGHDSPPSHHRLQEPREPKEEQAQMLLKICDDSEAAPR